MSKASSSHPSLKRGACSRRVTFALVSTAAIFISVIGWQRSAIAQGPFLYPVSGQSIDFEGDYLFKAAPVPAATGYLIGVFQNDQLHVENWRDYHSLSQEFGVLRGDPRRARLQPTIPTILTVRALVNGQWTPQSQITIYLVPRRARVNVLELRYFPLDANGGLDTVETGLCCYSLPGIRSVVNSLSQGAEAQLERSTIPAKKPSIGPYINYVKVRSIELDAKVPRSAVFRPFANHFAMLNAQNICNWVDNKGVRDVWIWMYHTESVAPIESNMSMGRISSRFFNHGNYGDISNSSQQNDLPTCNHTYVVYDFNYGRGVAEAVHDYGHQREALFGWASPQVFGSFVNPFGVNPSGTRACGNVHNPPNSRSDYDYASPAPVPSNCSDWHPDGSGSVTQVNCSAWGCSGDPQLQYLVWWAQRIPGRGTTLSIAGIRMRNWGEILADFDAAASLGRRLTE